MYTFDLNHHAMNHVTYHNYQIQLMNGEATPKTRQWAIEHIAEDTLRKHYRAPRSILTGDDYGIMYDNPGYTDWTLLALHNSPRMVDSATGYTRNQMLAAILNAELTDEINTEYVRRIDAILNDTWVYPPSIEEQDRLYAQHQANRYMC